MFLKKNPESVQEAKEMSEVLKKTRAELSEEAFCDNNYMKCRAVGQSDLKKSVSNLFKFIAASDLEIVKTWEMIEKRGLSN